MTAFPSSSGGIPGEAAQLFAAAAPKVRWFDPELAEVTQSAALGRYQALIEAQTSDGYTYRTLLSFAKVPPGLLPDLPTPPFAEPPPVRSDFFPQLSEPQRAELSRHFWRACSDYMKSGQDAAIARSEIAELAALAQLRPERVAAHAPGFPDEKLEWGIGQVWMPDPSSEGREHGVLGPNVIGHGVASGSVFRVDPDHQLVVVIGRDRFRDSAENERFTARFMQTLAAGLAASSKSAPPAPSHVPVASR